ncbi:MAG: GNAT family N-acetyltransferase [Armatimonadota bacterium]
MPDSTDFDWTVFGGIVNNGLRLRFATGADFPFVQATVCHPSTLAASHDTLETAMAALNGRWAEGFRAPDLRHVIAEAPGGPVGYLRLAYPLPGPRSLWLTFLAISPERRGQGWGRGIMHLLCSVAASLDSVEQFGMHTLADNTHAQRLYASTGFRIVKREPWAYQDGSCRERLTYCQTCTSGIL